MTTFEDTLRTLEAEIRALRERAGADPEVARKEGFDEGFRTAHKLCTDAVRDALAKVVQDYFGETTVAPKPHRPVKTQPKDASPRLSAPTKDEMVRQYLREHPGAQYRDLNRDLTTYVATRVYALERRGEVIKDAEGRFFLVGDSDDPDNETRERL